MKQVILCVIATIECRRLGETVNCEDSSRDTCSRNPVPPFIKQAETIEVMMQNAERCFPHSMFTMATTGEQPLLQISQRKLYNHPPLLYGFSADMTDYANCVTAFVHLSSSFFQ